MSGAQVLGFIILPYLIDIVSSYNSAVLQEVLNKPVIIVVYPVIYNIIFYFCLIFNIFIIMFYYTHM